MAEEGKLPLRVYAMLDGGVALEDLSRQMAAWSKEPDVGLLTVRAVKLYADGALGSRGAWLFEPYTDAPAEDPTYTGLTVTPPDELRARILAVARAGFQPAVHAIGDRAVSTVLDDFELAHAAAPGVRPRVEHMQIARKRDIARLGAAGAIASMQPTHATSDGAWAEARLGSGTERQKGAYAWHQVLEAKAPLACGSDFPVEDIDPRGGLYSAIARTWPGRPGGAPWMPEERLSRFEAVRCFTDGPAFASFAEGRRGILRTQNDADFTAFDGDVFGVPPAAIPTLPIRFTMVGGRVVFSADPASRSSTPR
jgi:predicted amidohydrolase YtcJ